MVDSTNPRIMADNIKMLAAGGSGSTVEANPTGAATADLEKLGVDGTIYGIPTYTPPGFSTSEVDTGRKWIDNSPIYQIVKLFSSSDIVAETGGGKVLIGEISADEIVSLHLSMEKGFAIAPFAQGTNLYINAYLSIDNGTLYLHLRYGSDVSSLLESYFANSKVIIDYTKPIPEAEPESAKKTTRKKSTN